MNVRQTLDKRDGTWDYSLDYDKTYKLLVAELKEARKKNGIKNIKRLRNIIVLLTQLRNGSRIGEAISFIKIVANDFKRECYITVEKRKKSDVKRLMILPDEITKNDILKIAGFLNEDKEVLRKRVLAFAKKNYGFNTHSLRYAFITYYSKKGISPQVIAKMTKHAKLDYIIRYVEEMEAEDLLRRGV